MYLKNIMKIDKIKDEFGWAAPSSEQREYYLLIKVCCQDVLLLFSYS
jgi:hypothetical protein